MDEESFRLFIQVIKLIEDEEARGNKINDLISSTIDSFYRNLTEGQRKRIRDEFSYYLSSRYDFY
jgi:DNA-binding ferritin-like protein (Dps family)